MKAPLLASVVAAILTTSLCATPTISNVMVQQHCPTNGVVNVSYTVSGMGNLDDMKKEYGLLALKLRVWAVDLESGTSLVKLMGDEAALADGTHTIVWDMASDGGAFVSTAVVFTVSCETRPASYCVIDLSAGANASSYPVSFRTGPPIGGFNVDEYKTTKLVLKRIEPVPSKKWLDRGLEKPYFIGVFEMTQNQYTLIMGSNPSHFIGGKRPVEKVSHNAIRGSSDGKKWPESNVVDSSSFLGKLRVRTGLDFDLPTLAQWDYAWLAGTPSRQLYSYCNELDGNYMWYKSNSSSQTHDVGTKKPNSWGLYDMSGNVEEWCLIRKSDWYQYPTGHYERSERRFVLGGSWELDASDCNNWGHDRAFSPETARNTIGFRLTQTIMCSPGLSDTICSKKSAPATIDLMSWKSRSSVKR